MGGGYEADTKCRAGGAVKDVGGEGLEGIGQRTLKKRARKTPY